jgi:hypothetical protein
MKKLLLSAALVATLATPAFAQSFYSDFGTGNVLNVPQAERTDGAAGYGAYASEPAPSNAYASAAAPSHHHRWNSPTKEQYQTAPYQDENY